MGSQVHPHALRPAAGTRFHPPAADGVGATIGLYLADAHFRVRIADGKLTIDRGDAESPDLILDTDQTTLLSLVSPDGSVDDALASGHLRLTPETKH